MILYLITNKLNGKHYVGQTIYNLALRWRQHQSRARCGSSLPIHNAIRKYGADNFTVQKIGQAVNLDCLNTLERVAIQRLNTLVPSGYNLESGGNNKRHHQDSRTRISKSLIGKKYPPRSQEHRDNLSKSSMGNKSFLGHKHSEETKRRMSEARKKAWSEGRTVLRSTLGTKASEETKEKIRKAAILQAQRKGADGRFY